MIGDALYRLLQRDAGRPWITVESRMRTVSLASATVDAVFTVPPDFNWLVQNAVIHAIPGAGQSIVLNSTLLAVIPPGTVDPNSPTAVRLADFLDQPPAGAVLNGPVGVPLSRNWQWSGMLLGGGWTIMARGAFSGAVANVVLFGVHGYLIPKGLVS